MTLIAIFGRLTGLAHWRPYSWPSSSQVDGFLYLSMYALAGERAVFALSVWLFPLADNSWMALGSELRSALVG